MISALVSGSSGPDSSPVRGHCVVFRWKTLYSHGASLSTYVYKWVSAGGSPAIYYHPTQGEVEIRPESLHVQSSG